jgi:hypothetical protein
MNRDQYEIVKSDSAVVRERYPDACYRVRNKTTCEESMLGTYAECETVVELAVQGKLKGSFDMTPSAAYAAVEMAEAMGAFVEDFMEQHADAEVLEYGAQDGVQYLLAKGQYDVAWFSHTLHGGGAAIWNNLAEVGAPYAAWFSGALRRSGCSAIWRDTLNGQQLVKGIA